MPRQPCAPIRAEAPCIPRCGRERWTVCKRWLDVEEPCVPGLGGCTATSAQVFTEKPHKQCHRGGGTSRRKWMILHLIQNRKNKWNSPAPTPSLSGLYSRALPVSHHQPGDRDPAPTHPGSSRSSRFSLLSPFLPQASPTALPDFIRRHCRSEGKGQFLYYTCGHTCGHTRGHRAASNRDSQGH